ncbi:hypothetical protein ACSBR2_025908 [Camellia fascicularis]
MTHGLAEYIAQEEMDRKNGYWWSLDSKLIAFTEVDSSEIPLFRIMHQGKNTVGAEAQEDHAYPFVGASNVKVRLGVVSATGGPVTWMDLHCGEKDGANNDEEYLARVNWMHGNILTAQVLNRAHSKLKILRFDIKTGQRKVIMVEEQDTWINLHDCFSPLDKGLAEFSGGFIWASERTGFRHLYLHDMNGACLGSITDGDWMVEQIAGIDEAAGLVYFTGTLDSPLESHLYCAKLIPDGNDSLRAPQRLTHGRGRHMVVLDHQMQRFVDIHDSLDSPPRISLCSLQGGSLIMPLHEQPFTIPRFRRLQLEPPEIIQIQANDGTVLYGALYKPDIAKFGPPPYKTLISVYGGPSVQLVSDSWMNTVDMRAQYFRSKGILVWKMFMKNCGSWEDMGPRAFPVDEVHKISVLDIRLANADRHAGNILVQRDSDGQIVLIPIDHGYCLPEIFEDCTFDWLYWPQAHQPYSPDTIDYIRSLNADRDIELLKFYGWDLPLECARTLRISTMLLKKGAERGLTPFAIGSIMCRETLKKESVIEQIVQEAQEAVLPGTSEAAYLESVSLIMDRRLDELSP